MTMPVEVCFITSPLKSVMCCLCSPSLLDDLGEWQQVLVRVYDCRVAPHHKLAILHGGQHVARLIPAHTRHHRTCSITDTAQDQLMLTTPGLGDPCIHDVASRNTFSLELLSCMQLYMQYCNHFWGLQYSRLLQIKWW